MFILKMHVLKTTPIEYADWPLYLVLLKSRWTFQTNFLSVPCWLEFFSNSCYKNHRLKWSTGTHFLLVYLKYKYIFHSTLFLNNSFVKREKERRKKSSWRFPIRDARCPFSRRLFQSAICKTEYKKLPKRRKLHAVFKMKIVTLWDTECKTLSFCWGGVGCTCLQMATEEAPGSPGAGEIPNMGPGNWPLALCKDGAHFQSPSQLCSLSLQFNMKSKSTTLL